MFHKNFPVNCTTDYWSKKPLMNSEFEATGNSGKIKMTKILEENTPPAGLSPFTSQVVSVKINFKFSYSHYVVITT